MWNLWVKFSLLFLLLFAAITPAQLTLWEENNLITEVDIYLDGSGNKYSTLVYVNFENLTIDLTEGASSATIPDILDPTIEAAFNTLKSEYGDFTITKVFSEKEWGDTIRTHVRTGANVYVNEWSQLFRLDFSSLVAVQDVITDLEETEGIENAEEPQYFYLLTTEPNDPWYQSGAHWNLRVIQAKYAWDYALGSPSVTISCNDTPYGPSGHTNSPHVDLANKVDFNAYAPTWGGHMSMVGSVAGVETNNNLGIASLGWNLRLRFDKIGYLGLDRALDDTVQVINCSWITDNFDQNIYNLIEEALEMGVIVVAAAGNDTLLNIPPPYVGYPAAYNFGDLGQVIAVSGTIWQDDDEHFAYTFNHSPGTDPINDPTNAFIDVCAPLNVPVVMPNNTYGYGIQSGTSVSAPLVSALAGLIISENPQDPNLTAAKIYEIITRTSDRIKPIEQINYVYNWPGWSQWCGYGRINAHDALHVANGNPYRLRDLIVSAGPNASAKLNWEETYGLVAPLKVKIYRDVTVLGEEPDNFQLIDIIDGWAGFPNPIPVTEYIDEEAFIGSEGMEIHYYITAFNDPNESLPSNVDKIDGIVKKMNNGSEHSIPSTHILEPYPNPFNPTTTFNYFLNKDTEVSIELFNSLGERVLEVVNEFQSAGSYTVQIEGKTLTSGVYFLSFDGDGLFETKKIMLVK